LLISLIGVTGCTNTESDFVFTEFEEPPLKPPIEVTVDQLYEDYMTDPAAADDKYKRERLCFYEVEVEKVVDRIYSGDRYVKEYFINGNVKFVLRSASMMQNVKPGYVLNIVGECQGLQGMPREIVAIYDCWVESVIGDLGTDEWVDVY